VAVVGSTRRTAQSSFPQRPGSPLRRRLVVLALVVVSLALITVYFRESDGGTLHTLQNTGTKILRPFEVAADQVARPFRDLADWAGGLADAKTENRALRKQVDDLRRQLVANQTAVQENTRLRALLSYVDGPTFPADFRSVAATVIARAPSEFDQQITIAAGSHDGLKLHDPVVTEEGLVGQVTKVADSAAQVTLVTDESFAVSVLDLATSATGIVRHGRAGSDTLVLDRVTKDQVVTPGDPLVTAGWRYGKLSSLYPRGIPFGTVSSVGQIDTDLYKQIQVQPLVDVSSLHSVIVLVKLPAVASGTAGAKGAGG
jgi:rod shape-determining protein MreC